MAAESLPGAYDRKDAAEYLACSTELLRQYQQAGLIAPRYHGKKPVYLRADLDAVLAALPDSPTVAAR